MATQLYEVGKEGLYPVSLGDWGLGSGSLRKGEGREKSCGRRECWNCLEDCYLDREQVAGVESRKKISIFFSFE
jgi:hypothetical protein